jgi:hypothetical protein
LEPRLRLMMLNRGLFRNSTNGGVALRLPHHTNLMQFSFFAAAFFPDVIPAKAGIQLL